MSMRRYWGCALLLISISLLPACTDNRIEDVCAQLEESCDKNVDKDDCEQGAAGLRDQAQSLSCESQWDAYLDCAEEKVCGWADECALERAALTGCGVEFSP